MIVNDWAKQQGIPYFLSPHLLAKEISSTGFLGRGILYVSGRASKDIGHFVCFEVLAEEGQGEEEEKTPASR